MKTGNLFAFLVLLLAASCATAPTVPKNTVVNPPVVPTWTTVSVSVDGNQLIFVVSGSPDDVVPDLALLAMTDYFDLPLEASAPAAIVEAVQSFLLTMSKTPASDRYAASGRVHWRLVVSKKDWDSARAKFKAQIDTAAADPSLDLEARADQLLQSGKYSEALSAYVTAAAKTPREKADRSRALLAKVQDLLNRLTLVSQVSGLRTTIGQPFPTTVDVKLALGSGDQAPAVGAIPLRFNFKSKVNGRLAMVGKTVTTDPNGLAKMELPSPDFAVQDSLVVLVDVNPWLEALAGVPKESRDAVAALETIAADRKIQVPYSVESTAKLVPMFVSLADLDERGSVQRRQETTSALISGLQKAGYIVSGLPVNPTLLKSTNEGVILAAWKFQGKTSGRAVYGTIAVVSATGADKQFTAEVNGTVRVVDLATNRLVFQRLASTIATATDKASAIALAYRQWAAEAVAVMDSELP